MKKTILYLALTFSIFSCGIKEKIDSVNPLGGGEMTAKVDGKDWKAMTVQVVGKVTDGQLLSVGGVSIIAKSGIGVNFDLKKGKIEAGKSYNCGYETFVEITHDSDASGKNMYYSTDEPAAGTSGTIKVTTYDGTNIGGTFSGTLYDTQNKKMIEISNGKFSGKIGII